MFAVDEKIDNERIKQFASQIDQVPSEFRKQIETAFQGKENLDFYLGLLTGYANSYVLASSGDLKKGEADQAIGFLIAFVADHLVKQRRKH